MASGFIDSVVIAFDKALHTLLCPTVANRPAPVAALTFDVAGEPDALDASEKKHAGALMRINHVGEICAQALYAGQAFATKNEALRAHFIKAGVEENDHLAWTAERMKALGATPSVLNPLWYAGAFGLGALASRVGDRVSLGFVVETERQVQAHLQSHLAPAHQGGLPQSDHASRAVLEQMMDEEVEHADAAQARGAIELPEPVKHAMKAMAKLMTSTAYHI